MNMTRIGRLRILSLAVSACVAVACNSASSGKTAAGTQSPGQGVGTGWAFPGSRITAVYGAKGMVSTTDRIASEIGAEVIRRGGNAVDAAIATHFALAV